MYSLLPNNSPFTHYHWVGVFSIALFFHLLLFISIDAPEKDQGAKDEGVNGIEIGLKKLVASPPPSPPKIETPKKIEKKIKPKPKMKVQPKPIVKPKAIVLPIDEPTIELVDTTQTENNTLGKEEEASESDSANLQSSLTTAGGNPDIEAAYEATISAWLQRYKRYPSSAKRRGQEDRIEIEFAIDKDGNVLSHKIISESPYSILNKAVIRMLKRASPLPAVPVDLQKGKTSFTYIVPVSFSLN
ncbi:MAG: energy transducer TonB [Cellvibrionaceae bacterium]